VLRDQENLGRGRVLLETEDPEKYLMTEKSVGESRVEKRRNRPHGLAAVARRSESFSAGSYGYTEGKWGHSGSGNEARAYLMRPWKVESGARRSEGQSGTVSGPSFL